MDIRTVQRTALSVAVTVTLGLTAEIAVAADALEEVVVTGLRRESTLRDAPVAVNVFNEDQIREGQIERPTDIVALTPGVTMVQSNIPGEAYITIRGNTQTRLGESSAALVIDGVQAIDQNAINQELFDVQSIEVLKGPQGALYGRNAIGGAVVITTRKPTEEWEGKIRAGYGNGDEKLVQATVSGPVFKNMLGLTAGVSYLDRDGFYENINTGEMADRFEDLTTFARLYYEPNEVFSADIKFNHIEMEGGGINWNAVLAGFPGAFGWFSGDNTDIPYVANIAGFSQNDRTNASIKLDYRTDFGTFTAVGAYSITEDFYGADSYPYFFDPGLFNTFFPGATPPGLGAQTQVTNRRSEIATLDVRFQSSDDNRFRWMVGAFYATFDIVNRSSTGADTDNRLDGIGPFPFGSPNQTLGFLADEQDNEAYAFYVNTEFDVTDKLTVTASVRYDKETKNQTDVAFPGPPNAADPKGIPTWWFEGWRSREDSFSEVQPKFTVRYELSDEATVYASWGRGFKTGGFNPFGAGALIRSFNPTSTVGDLFDKEVADSFEAGAKIRLLDGRLSINLAGFYTETENAQLLEFFPAATLQAVSIAEGVDMAGGEIDFTLVSAAIEGLTVYGGVGILNTKVTEFASNPAVVGNERPSTSPYTANLGGTYTRELPFWAGAEGFGRLDWTFQGKTEWDWPNTPNAARSAIDLVNARLGMRRDNWEVAFVGKNLTNTSYNAEHIVLIPAAGIGALYRAQPRTYGGELIVRF